MVNIKASKQIQIHLLSPHQFSNALKKPRQYNMDKKKEINSIQKEKKFLIDDMTVWKIQNIFHINYEN